MVAPAQTIQPRPKALAKAPGIPPPSIRVNGGEVELVGQVSRSELQTGDTLRFWLTIRNNSDDDIEEILLSAESFSGFSIKSKCWRPIGGASCVPSDLPATISLPRASVQTNSLPASAPQAPEALDVDRIIRRLRPGQTLSVWGELIPTMRQEKSQITAVLSFETNAGVRSQVEVPLGEVVVRNWLDRVSTLLWPSVGTILGAFAGYILKRWQDQRLQKTETWNKMLPESHRLAMAYYAPLDSAARLFIEDTRRYKKNASTLTRSKAKQNLRQSFYWWMMFSYRYRLMTREAGAFYFKDRVGEELTVSCFQACEVCYHNRDESRVRNYRKIRDFIDSNETLDSFLNKLDGRMDAFPKFKDEWEHFESWVQTDACEQALALLDGFCSVLQYELNRPYEYWYGWTDPIALDDATEKVLLARASIIEQGNMPRFVTRAERYLRQAKRLTRKG
jgi:hypothetical protein